MSEKNSPQQMSISKSGINLIKKFEKFSPTTYTCPAGKKTIGYGHVVNPGVAYPQKITQTDGNNLLKYDIERCESTLNTFVIPVLKTRGKNGENGSLTQPQFDALCSFIFNVGVTAFRRSTMFEMLCRGDMDGAAKQFERWNKVGGKKVRGLAVRREAERKLFCGEFKP